MDNSQAQQELLAQTAKINWSELERFFAAGKLIYVAEQLDLISVGCALINDDKAQFELWTTEQLVHPVTDQQAQTWAADNPTLWACVVSPWVLVQNLKAQDAPATPA